MLYHYEIKTPSLSKIEINEIWYYNCCLYSSFHLSLKTTDKLPLFEDLILYLGKENLYSYLIDFIKNFDKIKSFYINFNKNLRDYLDSIKIAIFLDNENDTCELLTVIDMSKVNLEEIKNNNYNSLKNNFSNEINENIICILQQEDHFEPIKILSKIEGESNNKIKDFLNSEDRIE